MFRAIGHMAAACPRARWFLERLGRGQPRLLDLGFLGDNNHLLHDLVVDGAGGVTIALDSDGDGVREAGLPRTLAGDATCLPFPDDCFDVVTAGELLEHIAPCDPVLVEAHRVLKVGGRLLISTPNGFDFLKLLRWWLLPARPGERAIYRGFLGHPTHRNVLCPPSLLGRLDDMGFDIVDCQTRRVKVPLLSDLFREPLIFTWRIYPFTRLGEFLCVEARKRDGAA